MLAAILSNLNIVSVLVAAVAAWLFGAVWYMALSRPWMAAQGWRGREDMPRRQGLAAIAPFIISFVAELVMAAMLFGIIYHLGEVNIRRAVFSAFFVWLGFVATTITVNNAYPNRPLMLTAIDAGHWLGVLLVMRWRSEHSAAERPSAVDGPAPRRVIWSAQRRRPGNTGQHRGT